MTDSSKRSFGGVPTLRTGQATSTLLKTDDDRYFEQDSHWTETGAMPAIKALVDAVRPKPINVLVVRDSGLSVADIAALGVRRISVGGALALAAWTGFMRAAQTLKSEGSFAGLARLVPYAEINGLFATDLPGHQAQGR